MRRLGFIVLAVAMTALTARADVNYSAPLSLDAAAFKAKFADRRVTCQAEAAMRLGIGNGEAMRFCDCQIDVFARGFTPEEMRAVDRATFGSDEEADTNAAAAIAATTRLIPERKRVCGH